MAATLLAHTPIPAFLVDELVERDAFGVRMTWILILPAAEEAGRALAEASTLVILDNLETVPPSGLRPLLDAAADWSGQGQTRILLTTRRPDLDHPD